VSEPCRGLCVCASVCIYAYMSVNLFVCLSLYLFVCMSVCVSFWTFGFCLHEVLHYHRNTRTCMYALASDMRLYASLWSLYTHIHAHTCTYMHAYIDTRIHTHTHTYTHFAQGICITAIKKVNVLVWFPSHVCLCVYM
jgi:hypothetical protein